MCRWRRCEEAIEITKVLAVLKPEPYYYITAGQADIMVTDIQCDARQ